MDRRQDLWHLICENYPFAVTLCDFDVRIGVIIVYLDEPSSGDGFGIGGIVRLFDDIHAVRVDAYQLGEEIQTDVITVEEYLYRLGRRSPCQPKFTAEFETHGVAQKAEVVISVCQQTEMLVFFHPKNGYLLVKFQTVRFLVESGPSVIAAAFYSQRYRCIGAADRLYAAHAVGIEI